MISDTFRLLVVTIFFMLASPFSENMIAKEKEEGCVVSYKYFPTVLFLELNKTTKKKTNKSI